MAYLEMKIYTDKSYEEVLMTYLVSKDVEKMQVEDSDILQELKLSEESWNYIDEDAVINKDEGLVYVLYFNETEKDEELMTEIKTHVEEKGWGNIEIEKVDNEDWAHNWKKYFKTFRLGKDIVVVPSWEDFEKDEGDIIVNIDPGMAFGTGTHETTSMCSALLEKYVRPGNTVFDVGCGSGILSVISAVLGAKKVVGVDIDPQSIQASRENVAKNNVGDVVTIEEGDLFEKLEGKADIIVSNIIASVIIDMLGDLKNYLVKNGIFIASGIIQDKKQEVLNALEEHHYQVLEKVQKGEWIAIVCRVGG